MKYSAKAKIQIQKPIEIVFEAIVNPEHMKHYFIAESSGRLEAHQVIEWSFPEFPDRFPIQCKDIIINESISFDWSGGQEHQLVHISLTSFEGDTIVKVEEGEMDDTEKGINTLIQQTEGWANFLACLKAYLDHGINLRKGAFDFMKN